MKNIKSCYFYYLLIILLVVPQLILTQEMSFEGKRTNLGKVNLHAEFYGLARLSAVIELNITNQSFLQFGIGIGGFETIDDRWGNHHEANPALTPSIAFQQLIGKGVNKLELGIGFHHGLLGLDQLSYPDFYENPFAINGFIGWRKKYENGLIFRLGFAPMYQPAYNKHDERGAVIWPLAYISFGKSIFPLK